jgi:hypothetical protein
MPRTANLHLAPRRSPNMAGRRGIQFVARVERSAPTVLPGRGSVGFAEPLIGRAFAPPVGTHAAILHDL